MKTFHEWMEDREQLDEGMLHNIAASFLIALGGLLGSNATVQAQPIAITAPENFPVFGKLQVVKVVNKEGTFYGVVSTVPTSSNPTIEKGRISQFNLLAQRLVQGSVGSAVHVKTERNRTGALVAIFRSGSPTEIQGADDTIRDMRRPIVPQ